MNMLILACLTFFLTILLEILVVKDFQSTLKGNALGSALYTGLCTVVAGLIVLIYVESKWMIAVDAAGASVGAYIAVRYFHSSDSTSSGTP